MLPSNFAPWELVYYYYHKWCSLGEFDLLLNNLREKVRVNMGQKVECSLGIMDSQSVRWGDNRSLNGIIYPEYKANKGYADFYVMTDLIHEPEMALA